MQPTIFDTEPSFDGETFDREQDHARLTASLHRVFGLMRDGRWRTLTEIQQHAGGSEAGVSARLRDLRKEKFGGYTVERRRITGGTWEYKLCLGGTA